MGSGNAKFLVGLGTVLPSVRWFIIFLRTAKAKKTEK